MRLSEKCLFLLVVLSEKLGLSQAGIVEMAVRLLAERHKVEAVEQPPEESHD